MSKPRKKKPKPKPKRIEIWALRGATAPDGDGEQVIRKTEFAIERDHLPFGTFARAGFYEYAERVDARRDPDASRWYNEHHRPHFGEQWEEFLAECGGVGSVVLRDEEELRRAANLIAAHIDMPPPSIAMRHTAEAVSVGCVNRLDRGIELAKLILGEEP